MRARLTALTLLTASSFAAPASAADFRVPIRLPAGSEIRVSLETASVIAGDGVSNVRRGVRVNYAQYIDPASGGYRVSQSEPLTLFPRLGARANIVLSYDANGSLRPLRVLGLDSLSDAQKIRLHAPRPPDGPGIAAIDPKKITPESAAANMLVPSYLSVVQGLVLSLNKPLSSRLKMEVFIHEYQPPRSYDASHSVELVSLDRDVGKAIIETRTASDPAFLRSAASASPVEASVDLRCRYEMSLETGLAVRTECTRLQKWAGYFGKPQTIETKITIRQDLIPPRAL